MSLMIPSGRPGSVQAFVHNAAGSIAMPPEPPLPIRAEVRIKPRTQSSASSAFNRDMVRRLIDEERAVVKRRQASRQSVYETILFHKSRGMSRATMESRWGKDAVAEAFGEKDGKSTDAVR